MAARTSLIEEGDPDCPYGGILVETGIDENGNGLLDTSEVDNTQKVCNGAPGADGATGPAGEDGLNALISMTEEAPGGNCTWGGLRIDVGIDTDEDGVLDAGEITSTAYICNGADGATGWGVAGLIETDNAGNAYYPQVALDPDGNAVAVWYQSDGTRNNIWANRYTAGTGWGSAELIETDNAGSASSPQVALDPDGNAVAVWDQHDGTRYNIWANRYETR